MQPVLNIEDVRQVEQSLTLEGVSLAELMRRAGHAVAQEVLASRPQRVAILCGTGNNGGDGWVAAERLHEAGVAVQVVAPQDPQDLKSSLALMVAKSAVAAGVSYTVAPSTVELAALLSS